MSLDDRRTRPRAPASPDSRISMMAVASGLLAALALVLAAASLFAYLSGRGDDGVESRLAGVAPTSAAAPGGSPATDELAVAALAREVPGADPHDLPRFPDSVRVLHDEDLAGRIRWSRVEYVTSSPADDVRSHYREAFRRYGWFVAEVEVQDAAWRFDAARGSREVTLDITPGDAATRVAVSISDLVSTPPPPPPIAAGDDGASGDDKARAGDGGSQDKARAPKRDSDRQRVRQPKRNVTRDDDRDDQRRTTVRRGGDRDRDDDDDDDRDDDDDDD